MLELTISRNHQPLQAIAILLNHMVHNPHDPLASQYRKILDIAFAFMGRDGGIIASGKTGSVLQARPLTEGGSEAWNFLWRLRSRIWRRDGLDSSATLSRNEAAVLCRGFEDLSVSTAHGQNEGVLQVPTVTPAQADVAETTTTLDPSIDFMANPLDIDWDFYLSENFPDS